MRSTLITIFLAVNYLAALAQTNKPSAGDFGIRTGFYFQNSPGVSIMLGKFLPKNLESGVGVFFSFNNYSRSITDTMQVFTNIGTIQAKSENINKFFSYDIQLTPYLVYHFPIKSHVDVFAGGYLALRSGYTPKSENIERVYAKDYERKSTTIYLFPPGFGVGAGAIVGAGYFVHKNIGIGLAGNFGFSNQMQYGKLIKKVEASNSGALNPTQGTTTTETASTVKFVANNVSLNGGAVIYLNFFFARKKGHKELPAHTN